MVLLALDSKKSQSSANNKSTPKKSQFSVNNKSTPKFDPFDFDPDPFDVDKHRNVYSDVSIILRSLTAIYVFHTCFVLFTVCVCLLMIQSRC